jgi:hypothetical protein
LQSVTDPLLESTAENNVADDTPGAIPAADVLPATPSTPSTPSTPDTPDTPGTSKSHDRTPVLVYDLEG